MAYLTGIVDTVGLVTADVRAGAIRFEDRGISPTWVPSIHIFARAVDVPDEFVDLTTEAWGSEWTGVLKHTVILLWPEPPRCVKGMDDEAVVGELRMMAAHFAYLQHFGSALERVALAWLESEHDRWVYRPRLAADRARKVGKNGAHTQARKHAATAQAVRRLWAEYEKRGVAEHNRSAMIAKKLQLGRTTVNRCIAAASLRNPPTR